MWQFCFITVKILDVLSLRYCSGVVYLLLFCLCFWGIFLVLFCFVLFCFLFFVFFVICLGFLCVGGVFCVYGAVFVGGGGGCWFL